MSSHAFVICYLESGPSSASAMNLNLRNTGNAAAFDVNVVVEPALRKPNQKVEDVGEKTTFDASILPPGGVLQIAAALGHEVDDEKYAVKLSWAMSPGASDRKEIAYRFQAKDGFRFGWNTKTVHHVADELSKIRQKIPNR